MATRMPTAAAAAAAVAMVVAMVASLAAAQSPSTPSCAAKLVPCAQYMNGTDTPPAACCDPLKEAVKSELKCLCDLYASPEIFKAFNINITDALRLSKRCGISETTSMCPGNSPTNSPPGSKNAGHRTVSAGLPGLMSLFLALWSVLA
ncbi:non-specific lipid transfer protein GPI-anchored 7-like [Oryza brachyantha]|uniref:non-specific lipid transfer protein GPI-anchored 7-like n=1 Tax=Oryza brachyantha TaxID=4533 RepID=UPI001ADCBCDF|nr:non-specific lipid transfer protein GPI-anchored 7-like [Oryza brachyantha]